jgi:hypothetical protein
VGYLIGSGDLVGLDVDAMNVAARALGDPQSWPAGAAGHVQKPPPRRESPTPLVKVPMANNITLCWRPGFPPGCAGHFRS